MDSFFWNVHGIMNTMQEIRSIHDFMNRSKIEFIFIFTFYYRYLKYKNIFNLGIKTVLFLKYDRFNGFVGV